MRPIHFEILADDPQKVAEFNRKCLIGRLLPGRVPKPTGWNHRR
jgi:hypothetical protein